jgi:heme-degrading monooxygenase HmoA
MSMLSCITVTLKDADAEAIFVSAFLKALESTEGFPGLQKLIAAKVIGTDHAYHLHTEWESQEAMDAWQANPGYRAVRDAFDVSLVALMEMSKWSSVS